MGSEFVFSPMKRRTLCPNENVASPSTITHSPLHNTWHDPVRKHRISQMPEIPCSRHLVPQQFHRKPWMAFAYFTYISLLLHARFICDLFLCMRIGVRVCVCLCAWTFAFGLHSNLTRTLRELGHSKMGRGKEKLATATAYLSARCLHVCAMCINTRAGAKLNMHKKSNSISALQFESCDISTITNRVANKRGFPFSGAL